MALSYDTFMENRDQTGRRKSELIKQLEIRAAASAREKIANSRIFVLGTLENDIDDLIDLGSDCNSEGWVRKGDSDIQVEEGKIILRISYGKRHPMFQHSRNLHCNYSSIPYLIDDEKAEILKEIERSKLGDIIDDSKNWLEDIEKVEMLNLIHDECTFLSKSGDVCNSVIESRLDNIYKEVGWSSLEYSSHQQRNYGRYPRPESINYYMILYPSERDLR